MDVIALGLSGNFRTVSVAEMKSIEDWASSIGITRLMLMENAGKSISDYIAGKYLKQNQSKKPINVLIFAGVGNNGGDAIVAARHLSYWHDSFQVTVYMIGNEESITAPEAKQNWEIMNSVNSIAKRLVSSPNEVESQLSIDGENAEVIIAGIFGTGFKGKPRDLQMKVIEWVNHQESAEVISVDLPSAMDADTGACDFAIESDTTITMHAPKTGMLATELARKKCGQLIIANIGVPR